MTEARLATPAVATPRSATGAICIGSDGWQALRKRARGPAPEPVAGDAQLADYARHFDVVEVRQTLRARPSTSRLQAWHAAVPAHFRFMVSVPRNLCEGRRLRDCDAAVHEFVTHLAPLGEKLGGLLFDLPQRGRADAERLHTLLAGLQAAPSPAACYVALGDGPWGCSAVREAVDTAGATVIHADALPARALPGRQVYLRVGAHAAPGAVATLRDCANRARSLAAQGASVTIVCQRSSAEQGHDSARRLRIILAELDSDRPLTAALR